MAIAFDAAVSFDSSSYTFDGVALSTPAVVFQSDRRATLSVARGRAANVAFVSAVNIGQGQAENVGWTSQGNREQA